MKKKKLDFNGYDFDDEKTRKRMKYLVIRSGDLDLNNAYSFRTKKEIPLFVKESHRDVFAIFEIKDITNKFL